MEKDQIIQVGGDLDSALKGQYRISPKAVLKEAWQKTQNTRKPINLGLVFIAVLGMMVSLGASQYFGGIEKIWEDQNHDALNLINLLVNIVIWPFLAGIEMMGVLHAVGLKTQPKLIFAFLKRANWVILCALISSILVSIGFQLLVVPGIYLLVALSLSIPLVVEKQISPLKAIILSIKALRFQWFNIFAIYFFLSMILVVALVPVISMMNSSLFIVAFVIFLFLLSYLAPCYYNVKGILYREIFGMRLQATAKEQVVSDDIFNA